MPKKDPFEDLPDEWKEKINSQDVAALTGSLSEVCLSTHALKLAQDLDEDLKRAKEAASVAGEVYRDGFKTNKVKITYIAQLLKDKGAPIAAILDQLAPAKKKKAKAD